MSISGCGRWRIPASRKRAVLGKTARAKKFEKIFEPDINLSNGPSFYLRRSACPKLRHWNLSGGNDVGGESWVLSGSKTHESRADCAAHRERAASVIWRNRAYCVLPERRAGQPRPRRHAVCQRRFGIQREA